MDLSVFSSSLNASQLEAVTYCNGPSLVIAGAGSGKTRVLTYKIAYLLQNGYEPWSILALTFTNKAAREMNEKNCYDMCRTKCQRPMERNISQPVCPVTSHGTRVHRLSC